MGDWHTIALEDGLETLLDYRGKSPPKSVGGIPVISAKVVKDGRVIRPIEQQIAPSFYPIWMTRGLPRSGDVVLTTEGPLGEVAQLDEETARFALGQRVVCLRAKPRVLDGAFLKFLLLSPAQQSVLAGFATGTTVAGISQKALRSIPITIPSYRRQVSIGRLLAALDDKIDLNRRMNETLEAMARAIFKDWFVDFGPTRAKMEGRAPYLAPDLWALFPDRLDERGRPEEWHFKPLDRIAHFLNGLALQKYPPRGTGSLPVVKIAQLRAGQAGGDELASDEIPADYVVDDGDVLFSWSGSLLHRVWTGGRGALNQHLFKLTSADFPKWFVFHWIGEHMKSFRAIASSKATTMGHIQRRHLTEAITTVPDQHVMDAADGIIGPLFDRATANGLEARTLASTRDLLLPKLMSGEVRIREAERVLEDVA